MSDFSNNEVVNEDSVTPEGKTRALIAHILFIGWLIALIQNNNSGKDDFASFYIRQMLGLILLSFVGWLLMVVLVGFLIIIASVVFWIMSIISANNGEKKAIPIVGELFQVWFKEM